jgi:hypothetical protein
MPTHRETVLASLFTRLQTIPSTSIKREAPLAETIPAPGVIILRDGDPGEPEVLLSPATYLWQHRAEIEVIVQDSAATAAGKLDDLLSAIGKFLAADRTLGGLVDWMEWGAPQVRDLAIEGAAPLKAAVVPVVLHYASADPLA